MMKVKYKWLVCANILMIENIRSGALSGEMLLVKIVGKRIN